MNRNRTPKIAMWLLRCCTPRAYREAIIGDVIEMREAGRSYLWCWHQALAAVLPWIGSGVRASRWFTALKALIVAFGMITLGMGTMVWAESLSTDGASRHIEATQ
jgi:hypothetical protein